MRKSMVLLIAALLAPILGAPLARADVTVDPNSSSGWTNVNDHWVGGVSGSPFPQFAVAQWESLALPDGTVGVTFDCVSQGNAHLVLRWKANDGAWRLDHVNFKQGYVYSKPSPSACTWIISGLNLGDEVKFDFEWVNSIGVSGWIFDGRYPDVASWYSANFTGPLTVTSANLDIKNLKVEPDQMALGVSWDPPVSQTFGGMFVLQNYVVQVFRGKYKVLTQIHDANDRDILIDGLTPGISYKVTVTSNFDDWRGITGRAVSAFGVPLIPTVMNISIPSVASAGQTTSMSATLTQKSGDAISGVPVTFSFTPDNAQVKTSSLSYLRTASMPKTTNYVAKTNKKGVVKISIKIKKSGTWKIVFKGNKKQSAISKSRHMRVK